MTGHDGRVRSGFWRRVLARLIDGALIGVPALILFFVIVAAGPSEIERCPEEDTTFLTAYCEEPTGTTWAMVGVSQLAVFAGTLFYIARLDGRRGATVGRMAAGIELVDRNTLQPIGAGRAVGRFFGSFVSGIPFYLGYLWMLWDPDKQTWHDKMVNSLVVRKGVAAAPYAYVAAPGAPPPPGPQAPPPPAPPPPPPAPPPPPV